MQDRRKKLIELIESLDKVKVQGDLYTEVTGITSDSREVKEGYIFVALPGSKRDGKEFIEDAIVRGAKVIVTSELVTDFKVTTVKVEDIFETFALICRNFWDKPDEKLYMIGVTGTNGKTTVTYLVESILGNLPSFVPSVIGTVNYRIRGESWKFPYTTPQPNYLHESLYRMLNFGATHTLMEVSSHALKLKRVKGINWNMVVFTNLSQDHLDFHQSMEDYANSKLLLFTEEIKGLSNVIGVINVDDQFGDKIRSKTSLASIITYGVNGSSLDVFPIKYELGSNCIKTKIKTPLGDLNIESSLIGKHNLYNILSAVSIGIGLGIDLDKIKLGIEAVKSVPGRLERIESPDGKLIFVDYAHTPQALENVLKTLREVVKGRLIVVFGAGGDRDKSKRPVMGEVVSYLSDLAIVTNDNPRTEDPNLIISMVVSGMKSMKMAKSVSEWREKSYLVIPDRRKAIETAIVNSEKEDCVLIAGKGHENYQIIGDKVYYFDDREVVKEILEKRYNWGREGHIRGI